MAQTNVSEQNATLFHHQLSRLMAIITFCQTRLMMYGDNETYSSLLCDVSATKDYLLATLDINETEGFFTHTEKVSSRLTGVRSFLDELLADRDLSEADLQEAPSFIPR